MKTILIIILSILAFFGILNFLSKYIIYLLKFKHEALKRRFPKYKWHIERLHEIYIKKAEIVDSIKDSL